MRRLDRAEKKDGTWGEAELKARELPEDEEVQKAAKRSERERKKEQKKREGEKESWRG